MRLIGRSELLIVARGGDILRGAALSLAAELEAADWRSQADAVAFYPSARVDGSRLIIDLGNDHCAVVAISYGKGVASVEMAGPKSKVEAARGKRDGGA